MSWILPHLPPPGISGWNFHQGWPMIKKLIDDVISHVTWLVCILKTKNHFCWHQQKMADDVISSLLWSRRLPRVSFNLITCLEPMKQDDHYFYTEILVYKFYLVSRKACLRMRRSFCHQIFLCQNVPKEIFFIGVKFHEKPWRGSRFI